VLFIYTLLVALFAFFYLTENLKSKKNSFEFGFEKRDYGQFGVIKKALKKTCFGGALYWFVAQSVYVLPFDNRWVVLLYFVVLPTLLVYAALIISKKHSEKACELKPDES